MITDTERTGPGLDERLTLEEALKEVHGDTAPVKEYVCDVCGRDFGTRQGLASHKTRTHGGAKRKPSARRRKHTPRRPQRPKSRAGEFDANKVLGHVAPNGTVPTNEIENVVQWLTEGRALHGRLSKSK